MKKKAIFAVLLALGIILFCLPIILATVEAVEIIANVTNVNIIGGADKPTFMLVFSQVIRGRYSSLSLLGIVCIIIAIIVGARKNKK